MGILFLIFLIIYVLAGSPVLYHLGARSRRAWPRCGCGPDSGIICCCAPCDRCRGCGRCCECPPDPAARQRFLDSLSSGDRLALLLAEIEDDMGMPESPCQRQARA